MFQDSATKRFKSAVARKYVRKVHTSTVSFLVTLPAKLTVLVCTLRTYLPVIVVPKRPILLWSYMLTCLLTACLLHCLHTVRVVVVCVSGCVWVRAPFYCILGDVWGYCRSSPRGGSPNHTAVGSSQKTVKNYSTNILCNTRRALLVLRDCPVPSSHARGVSVVLCIVTRGAFSGPASPAAAATGIALLPILVK